MGKSDGSDVFLAVVRVVDAQGLLGKFRDGADQGWSRPYFFDVQSILCHPFGCKCSDGVSEVPFTFIS